MFEAEVWAQSVTHTRIVGKYTSHNKHTRPFGVAEKDGSVSISTLKPWARTDLADVTSSVLEQETQWGVQKVPVGTGQHIATCHVIGQLAHLLALSYLTLQVSFSSKEGSSCLGQLEEVNSTKQKSWHPFIEMSIKHFCHWIWHFCFNIHTLVQLWARLSCQSWHLSPFLKSIPVPISTKFSPLKSFSHF